MSGMVELLFLQPSQDLIVQPFLRGKIRPCLSMKALTCCRCTRSVSTAAARPRTRSRIASWPSSGTHTAVSSPARKSLAKEIAPRLLVFT